MKKLLSILVICSLLGGSAYAENVKQSWEMANSLVNSYGGRFYAILEPHITFNNYELYNFVDLKKEESKY